MGTSTDLLALDANKFGNVVSKWPGNHAYAYGQEFVRALAVIDEEELTDIGEDSVDMDFIIACAFPDATDWQTFARRCRRSRHSSVVNRQSANDLHWKGMRWFWPIAQFRAK